MNTIRMQIKVHLSNNSNRTVLYIRMVLYMSYSTGLGILAIYIYPAVDQRKPTLLGNNIIK